MCTSFPGLFADVSADIMTLLGGSPSPLVNGTAWAFLLVVLLFRAGLPLHQYGTDRNQIEFASGLR